MLRSWHSMSRDNTSCLCSGAVMRSARDSSSTGASTLCSRHRIPHRCLPTVVSSGADTSRLPTIICNNTACLPSSGSPGLIHAATARSNQHGSAAISTQLNFFLQNYLHISDFFCTFALRFTFLAYLHFRVWLHEKISLHTSRHYSCSGRGAGGGVSSVVAHCTQVTQSIVYRQ